MEKSLYRALVWAAQRVLCNGRKNHSIIPQPCIICHKEKVEGHHTDYRNPLEVVWLCSTHHKNAHKGILQFLGPDTIYRLHDRYGTPIERSQGSGTREGVLAERVSGD